MLKGHRSLGPVLLTWVALSTVNGKIKGSGRTDRPYLHCNFDDELICGWEQLSIARVEWGRQKNDAEGFGPPTDHSGKGYYMYVSEGDAGPEQIAILASSSFPSYYEWGCVTFWVYTYGFTQGYLKVMAVAAGDEQKVYYEQNAFIQRSITMQNWTQMRANISTSSVYHNRVLFFGSVSGHAAAVADICIDDVTVWPGDCVGGGLYYGGGITLMGLVFIVIGVIFATLGILMLLTPFVKRDSEEEIIEGMDAWRRRSTRRMTPRKTRQSASLRKPIKAKKAAPPEAGQYATTNVDTGLVEYTAHPEDSCLQSYWAKEGDTEGKDCCKKSSDTQVKIHCSFENPSEAEAEAGAAGSASEEPATEANTESPTPENPIEIKVNFVE